MIEIAPFSAPLHAAATELILSIQRDEFGFPVTLEDQPDLSEIPTFYQSGHGGFWLALDGPLVVGTIALRDMGNRQGALRKMFVKSTHRGREGQVANRLLGELIDAACRVGISDIFLGTTERFAAAHRFYEKNGFDRLSEDRLPASFPRMAVDTRFYQRRLNRSDSPTT